MILSATIDEDEDAFFSFYKNNKVIRVHETKQRMLKSAILRNEYYLRDELDDFNKV